MWPFCLRLIQCSDQLINRTRLVDQRRHESIWELCKKWTLCLSYRNHDLSFIKHGWVCMCIGCHLRLSPSVFIISRSFSGFALFGQCRRFSVKATDLIAFFWWNLFLSLFLSFLHIFLMFLEICIWYILFRNMWTEYANTRKARLLIQNEEERDELFYDLSNASKRWLSFN